MNRSCLIFFTICLNLLTLSSLRAQIINISDVYSTEFEANEGYVVGQPLVEQNGWRSLNINSNLSNGILSDFLPGKGQSAFVGQQAPTPEVTANIFRFIFFDPQVEESSFLAFSVLFSIESIENNSTDVFTWFFSNSNFDILFTIALGTSKDASGNFIGAILTQPSGAETPIVSEVGFEESTTYNLIVFLDFNTNFWTALLDNSGITDPQPIAAQGTRLDLGAIDLNWIGSSGSNTFIVFDDYFVDATKFLELSVDPLTTNDSTPKISGTVNANNPEIKDMIVTINNIEYSLENNQIGLNESQDTWEISDNVIDPPLTEGVYDILVSITTLLDEVGTDTSNNELVIDLSGPVISICPASRSVTLSNTCEGQIPNFTENLSVTDNFSTNLVVDQVPAPGSPILATETEIIIQAQDSAGNISECTTKAEIESGWLTNFGTSENWKLVSVPGQPNQTTILNSLPMPIWDWQSSQFRVVNPNQISANQGYWINSINTSTAFPICGQSFTDVSASLEEGWNLVGVSSTYNGLSSHSSLVLPAWLWSGEEYLPEREKLDPFIGYWIYANEKSMIP